MKLEVDNKGLQFWDAYICGDNLYFSARNFNGLFCLEKGKNIAEFIGHFPGEPIWQKNLHRQVIPMGKKLYFIPVFGTGISIYNIITKEFSYVRIGENQPVEISRAFVVEDNIFMVPLNLKKPFVLFHTVDNTYEMRWDLQKKILNQFPQMKQICFGGYGSYVVEQKIYLTISDTNIVLSLDLNNQQVDVYELPVKYKLRNIYYDNEKFYFTLSNQYKIVCWDKNTEKSYEYIIEDKADTAFQPYMTVIRWKKHLLLLPAQTDKIWELDEERNIWCIKPEYISDEFRRIKKDISLFLGYQYIDDNVLLLPWAGSGMLGLSKDGSEYFEVRYSSELSELVNSIQEQLIEIQISQGMPIDEDEEEGIGLDSVILALNKTSNRHRQREITDNTGEKIWNLVK